MTARRPTAADGKERPMRAPLALCALAAILLAGCTTAGPTPASTSIVAAPAPTPLVQPVVRMDEAPADAVPWSQVGPGWVLATWSPLTGHRPGEGGPDQPGPDTVTVTLFLVAPDGARYPVTTFPPSRGGAPELIDWSGDKTRALFATSGMTRRVTEVDLRTGAQRTIPLTDSSAYPRYTLPDGKALLLTSGAFDQPRSLVRVDLDGREQLDYPVGQDFGGVLSHPDGTELVVGARTGLALMGNDGTPGATLPVAGQTDCGPVRWWDADATVVLAGCGGHRSQLWLVPVDGAAPRALTAPNDGQHGTDLGDVNAWELPAGTFVQALGACGVVYLAELDADGTTTEVDVPDVQGGTIVVVGVNGDSLRLQAKAACGGGLSLVDYNPSTDTSTVLLGGPLNGGGVIDAVAFKGQR
jgi:TolB protein